MAAPYQAPSTSVAWGNLAGGASGRGRDAGRSVSGELQADGPARAAAFADRGATVPFEAQALLGARVRQDARKRLEVLLANFAGNSATVVLPWAALPETIPLAVPDRALHAEIAAREAVTPGAIRAAAATVALSGAAGAAALEAARGQAGRERARAADLHASLLPRVIAAGCGVTPGAAMRLLRGEPDVLRGALQTAAARIGLRPGALFARTEALAGVLLPVGLGAGPEAEVAPRQPGAQQGAGEAAAGPLRVLHEQLCMVRGHLLLRGGSAPPETRGYFARAAAAADATATLTTEAVAALDSALDDLPRMLAAWDDRLPLIAAEVERLEWLLDGWNQTLDHYARHIGDWLALSQQRTLDLLAALTPTLPAAETARLRRGSVATKA